MTSAAIGESTMEQTTILCYGDSNTYGYDPHTDGERYPLEAC